MLRSQLLNLWISWSSGAKKTKDMEIYCSHNVKWAPLLNTFKIFSYWLIIGLQYYGNSFYLSNFDISLPTKCPVLSSYKMWEHCRLHQDLTTPPFPKTAAQSKQAPMAIAKGFGQRTFNCQWETRTSQKFSVIVEWEFCYISWSVLRTLRTELHHKFRRI